MSRMTSTPRPSESQVPTVTLPADVISAVTVLHQFITSAQQLPPQVIVTCRNDRRAFGRAGLQAMSYRVCISKSKS
ncbi:hypothetical protein J3R82DRAFT_10940 [Butyriboletus roseoflavus]|nr:hypothetical protein J3R82DRAFT_10940 [Butyriboletus roseoflavus]